MFVKIKHIIVLIRELRKLSAEPDAHQTLIALKELIVTIIALIAIPTAIALWVILIKAEMVF